MKRIYFLILTLMLINTLFLMKGIAQDYVYHATLQGHTLDPESLAFSPDSRTLASGSFKEVILWDVTTGYCKATLTGHTGSVENIVFSPDGQTLVSTGSPYNDSPIVWDANSGLHLKTLTGYMRGGTDVVFSSNGQTLATAGATNGDRPFPGVVVLWDVHTNQYRRTLKGHSRDIFKLVFSPDSQMLASRSSDNTIRLWNVATGSHKKTLKHPGHDSDNMAFSPNAKILASGGWEEIRLWDAFTGKHKKTLKGPIKSNVLSIAFSPDGKILASGSAVSTIHLWDVNTGKLKRALKHPNASDSMSSQVIFSPDGDRLVTWYPVIGNQIHVWDASTGTYLQTFNTDYVNIVKFSPDGNFLASGSSDGAIRLWKLSTVHLPDPEFSAPPKPPANQVYNNAIHSVIWIVNPGIAEGSGILIYKNSKLAVTNAHITGRHNTIDVYFPASDEKGELIKDRNFYLTNGAVLKQLGYYTKGHVVAKNEKTDLVIIRLDGLPESAREIGWNFTKSPTTKAGELVYILGNPAKQELWSWTLGEFLNDHGDILHIQSNVFQGNSGGPVLNKQGVLLGIVARSDRFMNAEVIPTKIMSDLFWNYFLGGR